MSRATLKPTVKITAVFSTVIGVLVLGALSQIPTYQPRYRPDCEYKKCLEPITNHGNCPPWGSCQWYCQEKFANCTFETKYHCARDLHNKEQFTYACAAELFCLTGEEPQISVQGSTGKASVYCRPCYKKDVYNNRLNTSSATFSECKMLKKNLCRKEDNKIDCGNETYTELTKTDGYCRCDARRGYAARSHEKCFYENEVCFMKKCPDGMELLLNYTCGMLCPTGYARQPDSDICEEVSLTPSVFPFTTDTPKANATYEQTTSIRTLDEPSTNEQLHIPIIPIYVTIFVAVFVFVTGTITIIITMTIQIRKRLKNKGGRQNMQDRLTEIELTPCLTPDNLDSGSTVIIEAANLADGDSATQSTLTIVAEKHDNPAVVPTKDYKETRPTATASSENKDTSVRPKHSPATLTIHSDNEGLLWEKLCREVYRRLPTEPSISIGGFEYDNLKGRPIMEPTSWPTINAINVDGFVPYAIPGEIITNLYELISHLTCGSDELKYTLQYASASFGIKHFGIYRNKLTEAFKQSKSPFIDAKIFFEIHGIYIQECNLTEKSVARGLDKLLQEIVVTGITGPFHAELLSDVLDCNIIQHYENNRYHDRDVGTIKGINVYVESRKRELHIYWRKTAQDVHSYCLIPLFKNDDPTSAPNTNVSQAKKIKTDDRNSISAKIAEQKSYIWRRDFKTFEIAQDVVFDELKYIEFIKPDRVMRKIDAHGFRVYERPGGEFYSVYELISCLLCTDNSLMFILRLAAARYAMMHFEKYVTQLMDKFDSSFAANIFFSAHGITIVKIDENNWPKKKRKIVSDAFEKLVREAVNEGKGNAPFYVELLSGVLSRKITQHFEEKTYDGRIVDTIAGLGVSLTTDSSSDRELHIYWMKSNDHIREKSYWIFPLFKCVPNVPGMEVCEKVYTLLMNQDEFGEPSWLDIINSQNVFEFDKLKERAIYKPDTTSMLTVKTINVEGFTAYEIPGLENTCLYELMSVLLFGNSEKKYVMRLAAIRFALQNFMEYVSKLKGEFGKGILSSTKDYKSNAKLFFEIHSIEFKETESSSMEKSVLVAFTELVRETVNTGQGPFYVEFLRGALNCKINQYLEDGLYTRTLSSRPGFNVTLRTSTPPERELRIYRMKTSKIVPLFKKEYRRETDI